MPIHKDRQVQHASSNGLQRPSGDSGKKPIVLAAIEGNGSRPSHRGGGINDGKVMYTLNSVEVHGVVYELPEDNRAADGE